MRSTPILASIIGAATATVILAAPAQAADGVYRVGTDIGVGEYSYTATGTYGGSYYLCKTTRCEPGDDLIDIDVVSAGAHGYLSITSDVKFVKIRGLELTPA